MKHLYKQPCVVFLSLKIFNHKQITNLLKEENIMLRAKTKRFKKANQLQKKKKVIYYEKQFNPAL